MITQAEYENAIHVIKEYEVEVKKQQDKLIETMKLSREKKIRECVEHHYVSSGGKYSSVTQMTCQFCGDTIE